MARLTGDERIERRDFMRAEIARGRTWEDIAEDLGLSVCYAMQWGHRHGIHIHASHASTGDRDSERLTLMVAARLNGDTLDAIAAEHGLSRERVRQLLERAGIDGGRRPLSGFVAFSGEDYRFRYPHTAKPLSVWKQHARDRARRRNVIATLRALHQKLGYTPTLRQVGAALGVTGKMPRDVGCGASMLLGRLFIGWRGKRALPYSIGVRRAYRLAGLMVRKRGDTLHKTEAA